MGRNAPDRVGDVTAEPRMEDLLASIRKAINEDIGPDGAPAQPAGRSAASRPQEEPSATASEIQQLREKISRSRTGEPAASRDPAQRAASLAAALRSNTPRRAWRDIEPVVQAQTPPPAPQPIPQPPPRLRTTIMEPEAPPRPQRRPEPATPPPPRYATPERPAATWPPEERVEPAPREAARAPRADQSQILSNAPAQSVQSAFSRLAESVVARAVNELSIEELTAELLRPLLKQWLDENLPSLVERLVREEIERVARTGR
jgi:uncharacterized protein